MKKLLATLLTLAMVFSAMGTVFAYYEYDATIENDIKIDFVETTPGDAEGYITANIVLSGAANIQELNTADLTFDLKIEELTEGSGLFGDISYEIGAVDGIEVNLVSSDETLGDRYEFHYTAGNEAVENNIVIGTVKFTGYGKFDFFVNKAATTNLVTATTVTNNIVTYFTADGLLGGTLDLDDVDNDDATDTDGDTPDDLSDKIIAITTRALDIVVAFPNVVEHQVAAYQDMTVTVTGGLAEVPAIELGSEATDGTVIYGAESSAYTVEAATDLLVDYKDNSGEDEVNGYVINLELPINTNYTIEVAGAGYRTARYNVVLTEDKTVQFWNNVMEVATAMEIVDDPASDVVGELVGVDASAVTVNYLAGDIVEDSEINIYDLSAVVSYFATENTVTAASDYAKYDLNRDGIIDSKDVAYVLVSWGN